MDRTKVLNWIDSNIKQLTDETNQAFYNGDFPKIYLLKSKLSIFNDFVRRIGIGEFD